nr:uncharacterized protein CTRU02_10629 [Colletotrichum truncatum]KAF6786930.1 hypothetical protein CTRU02_10629 [Colletotrichum truncatum]
MTLITDLPCELIASILQSLDELRSLTPALLTCRHIYLSYLQSPKIATAILRQKVTPALLPYSVAALEAFSLPRTRDSAAIQDVLHALHNEPSKLADRAVSMPMNLLMRMSRTHDVSQALSFKFANEAWNRLRLADKSLPTNLPLSPTERFRFNRAFYRLQIFYGLFSTKASGANAAFEEDINSWFFLKHPLWENEQLECVHDFLEAEIARAKKIILDNYGLVYILLREPAPLFKPVTNSYWKLSQGIEFIYHVINTDSYDARRNILKLYSDIGVANFPAALSNVLEAYEHTQIIIGSSSENELLSEMAHQESVEDSDKGPFRSWYTAHKGVPLGAGLMLQENEWLRDCAYVLWDWNRVEKHQLLKLFEEPSGSRPSPNGEKFDEMVQSFRERSDIWQKGGSGYWSKGDTSRIVWPHENRPDRDNTSY